MLLLTFTELQEQVATLQSKLSCSDAGREDAMEKEKKAAQQVGFWVPLLLFFAAPLNQ